MNQQNLPQDIFSILKQRATCRNFKTDAIEEDVLEKLYEAACSAPSSGGFQRVSIIAVKDQKKKDELARLSRGQGFVAKAPINLIFCVDYRRTNRIAEKEISPAILGDSIRPLWIGIVDAVIVAQSVALSAEALGLQSCYNGNIIDTPREMSRLLKLPDGVVPAIMLTIGYGASQKKNLSKKYPTAVMVHEEEYKDMPMEELYPCHQQKYSDLLSLDEQRRKSLYRVALKQRGEEFAQKCLADVEAKQGLTAYQFRFGCFYNDDSRKEASAREYVDYLKEQGFAITDEL